MAAAAAAAAAAAMGDRPPTRAMKQRPEMVVVDPSAVVGVGCAPLAAGLCLIRLHRDCSLPSLPLLPQLSANGTDDPAEVSEIDLHGCAVERISSLELVRPPGSDSVRLPDSNGILTLAFEDDFGIISLA